MKITNEYIITSVLLVCLVSCIGTNKFGNDVFVGNFKEKKYNFFESFSHTNDKDFFYTFPFDLKFGGIRPYPFDSAGVKDYSWLRNPDNLIIAFNTAKAIGLEKFVSHEQYKQPNNEWCCHTQWENKSLDEIVKGFLQSDTTLKNTGYYSRFWQRRRKEGNLNKAWHIFKEIDSFYNSKISLPKSSPVDSTLYHLLDFDLKLIYSDSISYPKNVLNYFTYLKGVNLDYSAYKLIFHNSKVSFSQTIKDSLLATIKHDTLTKKDWEGLNDNNDGWILPLYYPDPKRYYGP